MYPNNNNNLAIRTNTDWRRPISPSNSTARSPTNIRSRSPTNIRPSGASKSVAALQQQWRAQIQDTNKRSHIRYPPKEEVIFDQESEETELTVQDNRSRSPSINRGSVGSIHSQEFRVVKEGWMYRKNGLMQWKPVYAVAKHGNSVKPGGLYLYKDVKCTNHVQTYDMSEVLEISPRAQDYKQGIKWEIRMLVKRDDVILGTDDMISRKDWVDSLTSIMGKVSIATQNELTSRIQSSEQMNRSLQNVAEELDDENRQLRDRFESLKEAMAKKENQFQQTLESRDSELKQALEKQEQLFHVDFQARERELEAELERTKKSLETKCAVFEREAKQWRTKYVGLESKASGNDQQAKIDSLEMEIVKWRHRVEELEQESKRPTDSVNETLSDVKFNIQLLRNQLKQGPIEQPMEEIKKSIQTLSDSLEEAKTSWKDLEGDILKFLETERQDADGKESSQKHKISLLSQDIIQLREELVGVSVQAEEKKMPSLTEKFDILMEMVENLQIGQSRLSFIPDSDMRKSDSQQLRDTLLTRIDETMVELIRNQEETQEEQVKHIKTIGNYLQLITNDIQNSAIPDLPALSQQLEDVVDRLSLTEDRLSKVHVPIQQDLKNISGDSPELYGLAKNTGIEEIVRRAVKGASKLQIEQVIGLQEQQALERKEMDGKMQRYEEHARTYFDKSMEKMHSDLHEFTGVMYEMLERLVLQALEQGSNFMGEDPKPRSGLSQTLKVDIEKLEQEKQELGDDVKKMKRDSKELEKVVSQRQIELRSIEAECEMARSRQESTAQITKELEPLMNQIMKLKKMAGVPYEEETSYINLDNHRSPSKSPLPNRHSRYEEDEETDRKMRFPTRRRGSFNENNNETRRFEQPTLKSPLVGARDRPRGKSPLASFLGRK
ncbi:unnamed protein product [Rhizopus stolonifer]